MLQKAKTLEWFICKWTRRNVFRLNLDHTRGGHLDLQVKKRNTLCDQIEIFKLQKRKFTRNLPTSVSIMDNFLLPTVIE